MYGSSLDTSVTFLKFLVLKFRCLDVNLVHIATTYVGILCLYDKTLHSSCFPSREKTADFSYFKRLLRIASKRTISIFGRKDKLLLKRKIGHYNSTMKSIYVAELAKWRAPQGLMLF